MWTWTLWWRSWTALFKSRGAGGRQTKWFSVEMKNQIREEWSLGCGRSWGKQERMLQGIQQRAGRVEKRRCETLILEVLGWGRKRGPKGKQHNEVPVVSCLETMGKTSRQAASDEISCDILGRALIIKQMSALCGSFSVKALRTQGISQFWIGLKVK